MSLYIFLYIAVIISLLSIWVMFIKAHWKFLCWKLLFLSMFSYSIWLLIYLISFTTTYDKDILLILSRLLYSFSLISIYFILLFIMNFWKKIKSFRESKITFYYLIILFLLFFIGIFSPYIIKEMIYDSNLSIYYEWFGPFYNMFTFLYLFNFPLFIFVWYKRYITLNNIKRIRFRYLFISFWFLLFNVILFLAFLPILWIWIFQKEQVLFFIPFILSVLYASHRYSFIDIKFVIWKVINFILSSFFSIFLINIFRTYFLGLDWNFIKFWGLSSNFWFSDLLLWIILYIFFYSIFKKYIFWNNEYIELTKKIWKLKKKINFLSTFTALNNFLNKEFASLIKTKYVNISLYNEQNNNLDALKKYFEKNKSYNLFINDTVFIEENKHKFDSDKIVNEISDKSYLIFPLINNSWEFLWVFEIWTKFLKDIYTSEEIDLFLDFVDFVVLQLKHIEIYEKMQDININLDKKIDEKTIEYNNLLNKQTDFISMISHEIKSPLGSCIFQIDSIIDDLKSENCDKKYLLDELEILNTQLLNVWDLTKTMFSIKKFDLNKIELFKSKVDINLFLSEKLNNYKKTNDKLEFILDIDSEIDYITIDKIQFGQVIDNLIVNAIKFSNKEKPQIFIKILNIDKNLIFEIEDNGEWFEWVDAENIFDKYVTGKISNVWIWMWMYLCKKIVELHGWNIKAWNGEYLHWASFKIVIPNIID